MIKTKDIFLICVCQVQLNERQKQQNRILFIGKRVVKLTPFRAITVVVVVALFG